MTLTCPHCGQLLNCAGFRPGQPVMCSCGGQSQIPVVQAAPDFVFAPSSVRQATRAAGQRGKSLFSQLAKVALGTLIAFGVAIVFFGFILLIARSNSELDTASTPSERKTLPDTVSRVTLSNFYLVKTGMTAKEVLAILGYDCELLAENEIGDIRTQMFAWQAPGFLGGNCNVMFQNGRVIQKAQFGLK